MDIDIFGRKARAARIALWKPIADAWVAQNQDCLKDGYAVYRPDGDGWVRLSTQEVRSELYPIASRAEASYLAAHGRVLIIPIDMDCVMYIRNQLPVAPHTVVEQATG